MKMIVNVMMMMMIGDGDDDVCNDDDGGDDKMLVMMMMVMHNRTPLSQTNRLSRKFHCLTRPVHTPNLF